MTPPVNELVLGIQLSDNLIGQLEVYQLYNELKDNFKSLEESNVLPTFELTENELDFNKQKIQPGTRKILHSNDENNLLQIQTNKIWFNWRKKSEDTTYPGYEYVKSQFDHILQIAEKIIPQLSTKIELVEITYVDLIELSKGNGNFFGTQDILKDIKFDSETVHIELFDIKKLQQVDGFFYRNINSAHRKIDDTRLLRIEMTARSSFLNSEKKSWKELLNQLHEISNEEFKLMFSNN